MILRKPNFQDIYKAVQLLESDEEEQKEVLQEWIIETKNPNFFSWVIVKEKKVLGVITGLFGSDKAQIGRLETAEKYSFLKSKLFDKVIKEFDPEEVRYTVKDLDEFISKTSFKTDSYNLVWNKQIEDTEIEDISSEEERDT